MDGYKCLELGGTPNRQNHVGRNTLGSMEFRHREWPPQSVGPDTCCLVPVDGNGRVGSCPKPTLGNGSSLKIRMMIAGFAMWDRTSNIYKFQLLGCR